MSKRVKYAFNLTALLFVIFFLPACASGVYISPRYSSARPVKVAVTPFENMTNDIKVPEVIRKLFAERLKWKGFFVQPVEETDKILYDKFEITLGGQLQLVEFKELARALNVDGIFEGVVEKAETIPLGFYNRKVVKVKVALFDAATGEKLWEAERSAGETVIAVKPKDMLKAAAREVTENLASQAITGHPLYIYCVEVVNRLIRAIP